MVKTAKILCASCGKEITVTFDNSYTGTCKNCTQEIHMNKCDKSNVMKAICSDCQQPCECRIIDEGIGSYEYWGAVGHDSRPTLVSSCCGAICMNESEQPISLQEFERLLEAEKSYYQN